MIGFFNYYKTKGHVFGECMASVDSNLMYVNIPKNASSWTKPNLIDCGWTFQNYHIDCLYHKQAIVVLRDPLDRWVSGIAEYFSKYHPNNNLNEINNRLLDVIFDRVAFDDHTEKQILFIEGLDKDNCIFLNCNETYRKSFSDLLLSKGFPNRYFKYNYQNVSSDHQRSTIKNFFLHVIKNNSDYKKQIEWYFEDDYTLMNSVKFYAG